jgi:S-adenosyl-L-methionine hydrolase (adenosine-forming)
MLKGNPIIALLTDFGLRDHYVGVVKGILLSHCPSLQIIDISHDVEPQNIQQGAYLLWASYRYLPEETVIAAIVDPGVGTSRDIIIATAGKRILVAPDNGVLDFVLWEEKVKEVTVVKTNLPTTKSILPHRISGTFHGRDVFAPLSAHLAQGGNAESLGKKEPVDWVQSPFVDKSNPKARPEVLHVDRFGNIITNIKGDEDRVPFEFRGLRLGSRRIYRWIDNYESAPADVPCLIVGSSGLIEIVIRNSTAAAALNADELTPLKIQQH